MLVLWDLKDSRDIVSKLSLMRMPSTAASLFADFCQTITQTPAQSLLVHHVCIKKCFKGSDSLWLISGCVLLSFPSAYDLVPWQYLFFGIKSISIASWLSIITLVNVNQCHRLTPARYITDLGLRYNASWWADCWPHVKKVTATVRLLNQWLEWVNLAESSFVSRMYQHMMSLTMTFNCL